MDLFQAIILGLIQGIAEWLPISSQGQAMAVALTYFNIPLEKAFNYSVFLHIGTLISAVIYFRKDLIQFTELKEKKLMKFIAVALIGSAVTGIPVYFFLKEILSQQFPFLILIGLALIFTGLLQFKKKSRREGKLNSLNGLILGLAQGFSVVPGISRSGVTTSILLFEGFNPEKAFRISFLLSIPTVFLAEILFSLSNPVEFAPEMIIAIIIAAISGFISIKYLLELAKKISFAWFAVIFGLIYLILAFI